MHFSALKSPATALWQQRYAKLERSSSERRTSCSGSTIAASTPATVGPRTAARQATYYPGQDLSGSSSGSGVSSSLGLALAALGTETDGSILSHSNVNNLVGIELSVGL